MIKVCLVSTMHTHPPAPRLMLRVSCRNCMRTGEVTSKQPVKLFCILPSYFRDIRPLKQKQIGTMKALVYDSLHLGSPCTATDKPWWLTFRHYWWSRHLREPLEAHRGAAPPRWVLCLAWFGLMAALGITVLYSKQEWAAAVYDEDKISQLLFQSWTENFGSSPAFPAYFYPKQTSSYGAILWAEPKFQKSVLRASKQGQFTLPVPSQLLLQKENHLLIHFRRGWAGGERSFHCVLCLDWSKKALLSFHYLSWQASGLCHNPSTRREQPSVSDPGCKLSSFCYFT